MNGNGMNGNGAYGGMTGNEENGRRGGVDYNGNSLAEKIRALTFVKQELELYLDTHPGCRVALDYYHKTIDALKSLTEEYHNTHGPLVASGVTDEVDWTWVDEPWPWHRADEKMSDNMNNNRWKGKRW